MTMTKNHTSLDDFLNDKELVNSKYLKELPSDSLLDGLLSKRITAAVIGLGPEGRSLALELAADMEVFCFDTDKETLTRFQATMNKVLSQLSVMTQSTTFSFAAQVKELKKGHCLFH